MNGVIILKIDNLPGSVCLIGFRSVIRNIVNVKEDKMNIVVLAGGLSTERDVSFKTGSMVAKALKENGHKVILLDVFMGYSDREEDLTGIFDRADEISVQVSDIPTEAPDLAKVKASRKDQSPCFFGPNVIKCVRWLTLFSWLSTEKTERTERYRQHLISSVSNIQAAII